MNNEIGERIKQLRISKNMSAETLGSIVGVAKTSIYRYESGYIEKMPTSTAEKIAKALNVSVAYLMGWTDNPSQTVPQPDDPNDMKTQISDLVSHMSEDKQKLLLDLIKSMKDSH